MKFIFFTDVHATMRKPSGRKDDYYEVVLRKLAEVKELGDKYGVDFYVSGGDLFHTPDPSTSCQVAVASILKSFGKPIYSAVGSHDHFNYQWHTLKRTALGLLHAAGVIILIEDTLPMMTENAVLYFSHHSHMIDSDAEAMQKDKMDGVDYHIHIVHGALFNVPDYGVSILPGSYPNDYMDLVLSGHIHLPFTSSNMNATQFVNPGSLLRVKTNEQHEPSVVLVEVTDKIMTTVLPISYEVDVFRESAEVVEDVSAVDFSATLNMMDSAEFQNSIDIKKVITEACEDTDVLNECLDILEVVDGN